jgi:hypothetical protein
MCSSRLDGDADHPRFDQRQERQADGFAEKKSGTPEIHRRALRKLHVYAGIPGK